MDLQATISEELAQEMVGKEVKLLVDETDGETLTCRSQWDSPEVDMTYDVTGAPDARTGDFIRAVITGADTFDFTARALES